MTVTVAALLELSRPAIVSAIAEAGGNVTVAARALGVSHRTLCRWVATLKIEGAVDASRAPEARAMGRKVRRARRQG